MLTCRADDLVHHQRLELRLFPFGELVDQGVAVMLISSEMPELLGLADRIAVMHEGKMQGLLDIKDASQETIMGLALGTS